MGQKKLIRFAEIETFPNVFRFPGDIKGKWGSFFKNDNPLTLELACGKGEYTTGLAGMHPEQNFIGIDIKGNRIWVGAKKALNHPFPNVAFIRTKIDQLADFFSAAEVSAIWITFPDPQPRFSKNKKRLTHPKFLRLYKSIMKPGGPIHLKTDSPALYQFTRLVIEMYNCKIIHEITDVHSEKDPPPELLIKTHYEGLDIAGSKRVHYLSFILPEEFPEQEKDDELKERLRVES